MSEGVDTDLGGLRAALARRLPPREAPFNPFELGAALRARLPRLGVRERSGRIDSYGMDEDRVAEAAPLLDALGDHLWRVECEVEELPSPCLFAVTRAGPFPWDALMATHLLAKRTPDAPRPVFLVDSWLAARPFVFPSLVRLGALRASRANAERVLREGRSVVVFPEGARRGRTGRPRSFGGGGIVRTARAAGCPVVPAAIRRVFSFTPPGSRWQLLVGRPWDVSRRRRGRPGGDDAARITEALCESVCALIDRAEERSAAR